MMGANKVMLLEQVGIFTAFLLTTLSCGDDNFTKSTLFDEMMNGYDKRLPPKYDRAEGSSEQVVVTVNMFIISMFSVSEANMDYSMSMFLRERWVDKRLAYDNVLNLTRFEVDPSAFSSIWFPDMYILNEKSAKFHDVTVPNRMVHIYPDGTVQYSVRVTGTFSCLMHLQKYPFDRQSCHFEVESYGFDTKKIKLVWSENPITYGKVSHFAQFTVVSSSTYDCTKNYYGIYYPCIGVKFDMSRNYGYHIIQIYVPSVLIVILSWVNFWLDVHSTPARISLGLLTVLTMTTQSSGARTNLPRVSYVKAIDVWMASCMSFVFLALLEFAYVNVKCRVRTRQRREKQPPPHRVSDITSPYLTHSNFSHIKGPWDHKEIAVDLNEDHEPGCFIHRDQARATDKISRVAFPSAFIVFNIVYWFFYMYWEPEQILNTST